MRLSDAELVEKFEATTLPAEAFPHEAHVRVAWWYLRRDPLLVALARFRAGIQRFSAAQGKAERYHETITLAFMLVIYERLTSSRDLSWTEFAARHPDLLQWQPSILARFYTDETLASARAREAFLMPDRR